MSEDSERGPDPPAEPFFGDRGNAILIHRKRRRPHIGGYYWFGLPFIVSIIMFFVTITIAPGLAPPYIMLAIVVNGILLGIYLDRNTESALTFELAPAAVRLCYHDVDGDNIDEVPLDADGTVVDVILNEATSSAEYGHLYGWTFTRGRTTIKVSAFDDWDVWHIQALRDPVYRVIEHHDLERGRDLRYYQEGLRGVVPLRRRTLTEPPGPPNDLNSS